MKIEEYPKLAVAERQLYHAVDLYLEGQHLLSVITLAGAAEEILGKFLNDHGEKHALAESIENLCELYRDAYGNPELFPEPPEPDESEFAKLLNTARNGCKHYDKGKPLSVDIDWEAYRLLQRAIRNYQKLRVVPDLDFGLKVPQVRRVFGQRHS
ncbi:hypothetical protein [Elongatibacter sediminis]|uniref:HEPN domain-containing protein n=1 Tax=Elongatibacter sediminis TaxID=3119006 RepID=A0AAW9RFS7_9GAMM